MKSILFLLLIAPILTNAQNTTNCDCEDLWKNEAATAFVQTLEEATLNPFNMWGDYYPGQGEIVLNA